MYQRVRLISLICVILTLGALAVSMLRALNGPVKIRKTHRRGDE